ncbi:MAG: asparagine synthase (glutamine-hydrolyzing) [Planctomycetes bacterium]|nr:asparagine synthase (glutamine-hydrolyzing) [Planctomycetota bacterium]
MCGIFGWFGDPLRLPAEERLLAAVAAIAHRGPDAQRLERHAELGLALGHVRLSILDVDARSDQPFTTDHCTLVYNGEVFNFRELRAELEREGATFRTTSDTEVVAVGHERWGDAVFGRLRGMFALALWEHAARRLHLVRDEFGVKPLVVYERPDALVFASEVKAIAAVAPLSVDGAVLGDLLSWGFPLADESLYGVRFLPPGTQATYTRVANGWQRRETTFARTRSAYGDAKQAVTANELRDVVESSVGDHLIADVPVAVALSGGLDSSIVAVAASRRSPGLRALTFSLAADSAHDPEVAHATAVAEACALRHDIVRLHRADVGDWLRHVAFHLEEPIANPNALPGAALAAAVRAAGHKVVLVGEGADELFGGYPWYRFALDPEVAGDAGLLFDRYRQRRAQGTLLGCLRPEARHRAEERSASQRAAFVAWCRELPDDPLGAFQSFDLTTQLQYSQLLRVDRMFMAHGVEARVPFLFRPVLEASARLSPAQKLLPPDGPGRREKVALGAAFAELLPPAVAARPKFGATGTVDLWSTWLAEGLAAAHERCVRDDALQPARDLLAPWLDWERVATARLSQKERFSVALLVEAVHCMLVSRRRPAAWPAARS